MIRRTPIKLYEIGHELQSLLDSTEGELTPEVEAALATIEMAFEQKCEAVLKYRQALLGEVEAINLEVDRLTRRAGALATKAQWLRNYVLRTMQVIGVGKVSTPTFSASVAKSPPSVLVEPDAVLPPEYQRTSVKVETNKAAILADYKAGKPLPVGVAVFTGSYLKVT